MKLSRFTLSLMLLLALAGLSACGTDEKDKDKDEADKKSDVQKKKEDHLPICPHVAVLRDLDDMKDFGTEKADASELVGQAKMLGVTGSCTYTETGVDVNFELSMLAAKGPRLGGLHISFPYFIALTAPDQTILDKNKMMVEFNFSSDKKITDHSESLHVFIPMTKEQRASGPDYQVLIGFQLDEDQLNAVRNQGSKE